MLIIKDINAEPRLHEHYILKESTPNKLESLTYIFCIKYDRALMLVWIRQDSGKVYCLRQTE